MLTKQNSTNNQTKPFIQSQRQKKTKTKIKLSESAALLLYKPVLVKPYKTVNF